MQRFLRGLRHASNWLSLAPILIFLIMAQTLNPNTLAVVINSLDIGVWILVLRAYVPPLWRKLRESRRGSADIYMLGAVLLSSTALAMSRLWSIGIILAGKPAWMINHWFQSFCYMLIALSYYYFLRIPGSLTSAKYIAYALAASVTIAVMIVALTGV